MTTTWQRSPFSPRPAPRLVRASGDTAEAELLLYDEIGYFGIRAEDVVRALRDVTAPTLRVRINSPGGDVFEGMAIYSALRQHVGRSSMRLITQIDGLAASIASIIALAGDEVRIASNAFYMIHNPFGVTLGDAAEHRKTAEVLDQIAGAMIAIYAGKTGATPKQVTNWMDEETWFGAAAAAEAGFVDEIDDVAPAARAGTARFDLSAYRHVPAELAAAAATKPTVRDVERLLRDAGFSRSEAAAIASAGKQALSPWDAGEVVDGLRTLITTLKT
jgi:ATP-dependent protease ClpP protease subunit